MQQGKRQQQPLYFLHAARYKILGTVESVDSAYIVGEENIMGLKSRVFFDEQFDTFWSTVLLPQYNHLNKVVSKSNEPQS